MWGDIGRGRGRGCEIWGAMGRCREMWGDIGRGRGRACGGAALTLILTLTLALAPAPALALPLTRCGGAVQPGRGGGGCYRGRVRGGALGRGGAQLMAAQLMAAQLIGAQAARRRRIGGRWQTARRWDHRWDDRWVGSPMAGGAQVDTQVERRWRGDGAQMVPPQAQLRPNWALGHGRVVHVADSTDSDSTFLGPNCRVPGSVNRRCVWPARLVTVGDRTNMKTVFCVFDCV